MATIPVSAVEVFGRGVLKAEGVVVDKENNVYGGGRNGVMYKVTPEGKVSELATLPAGSMAGSPPCLMSPSKAARSPSCARSARSSSTRSKDAL